MLDTIRNKLRDVATISRLSSEAECVARSLGVPAPGSEHYVLAALALPDGTAARAFETLGLTEAAFASALRDQFAAALTQAGLGAQAAAAAARDTEAAAGPAPKLFVAGASGEALMQRLAESRTARGSRPLLGADVLLSAAAEEFSAAARAFRHLGIGRTPLADAAAQAIDGWTATD